MFSRVRIAIRFFFVGLAVGVLLAPRSGEETRRMLRQKADRMLNDFLDAASLGMAQAGEAGGLRDPDLTRADQVETPDAESARASSSGNGGTTRNRSKSTAAAGTSS